MQINADHQLELESEIPSNIFPQSSELPELMVIQLQTRNEGNLPYKIFFWIAMKEKLWLDKLIDKIVGAVNISRFAAIRI